MRCPPPSTHSVSALEEEGAGGGLRTRGLLVQSLLTSSPLLSQNPNDGLPFSVGQEREGGTVNLPRFPLRAWKWAKARRKGREGGRGRGRGGERQGLSWYYTLSKKKEKKKKHLSSFSWGGLFFAAWASFASSLQSLWVDGSLVPTLYQITCTVVVLYCIVGRA